MNWRLTRDEHGEPTVEYRHDDRLAPGSPHRSLLDVLAAIPGSDMRQVRPGVYFQGNPRNESAALAAHDEFCRLMAERDE